MHEVEDEPLFAERVAGIDIAKAGIEVTIRVPSDTRPGRQQETRSFATTRRQLLALADWLRAWGVTKAGMEATALSGVFKINNHVPAGRALAYASATRRAKAATTRGSDQMSSAVGYLRHGRSCR